MNNQKIILAAIIAISFLSSILVYPLVPEKVASHWNSFGVVDGYMGKDIGLFITPFLLVFLFALYLVIPRIDPLKGNIKKFEGDYSFFFILLFAFVLYIHFLILAWNTGHTFDMNLAIVPALAVLFYFTGEVMGKSKRNWFMGIKTPWTLSSDIVWEKTHKLGEKCFKAASAILLLTIFFRDYFGVIILSILLIIAVIPIVYSYLEYKKEIGNKAG